MSEIISEIEIQSANHDSEVSIKRDVQEVQEGTSRSKTSTDSGTLHAAGNQDLWYVDMNKNHKRESVVSEAPSVGWMNVKKRLGTLAAVKTVMDSTKKNRLKKPVEQKDFLEKFSTREYNPVKGNKKSSAITPGRKISTTVSVGNHHTSITEEKITTNTSQTQKIEMKNLEKIDTVVTDEFCELDEKENICKNILYASVEPYGNFLYYWLFIVITAIHYNAWIILLRIAFENSQTQFQTLWFVLDYLADFVYLMDLIIHLRMSFLEDGIYVDNLSRLALAYVRSYKFALDIASIIPLDLLYFVIGILPSLRLLRMLKYYKVFSSQKTILSLTNYPNIIRTFFFLHLMLVMMHWNGCFYFMVSKWEGFGINQWVYPNLTEYNSQLVHQYAYCYYWSTLSLTTIGGSYHPETTIECTFMVVCYAIGIFIFATIVGQAGNVIQNMNATRMEFEKQRDSTMQYMKRQNVPEEVQRRVRLWYDYSYSRGRFQGDSDINDIVLLPNKMKTELALHVHLETLRRVTFLQKCQPEFLHDLVLKMKLIIFTPGDYICRKGEVAREMYVISNGILEVLSETGRILKVLHSGDFFGEIGILSLSKGQNRRTADVRAYGYVELFVLSKDDVLNAIKEYPDTQKILAKYGRNRLKKDTIAQGGPRTDTTSESDEDQESVYLNLNSSTGLANLNDRQRSSDSRRSSHHKNSLRRDNEARRGSILKIPVPIEDDNKSPKISRVLPISDKFTHNSSVLQGAMMSVINPVMQPASKVVAGIRSPTLEKKSSCLSILVNSDVLDSEKHTIEEDFSSVRKQRKTSKVTFDTEQLIEMMQSNQEELLNSMKSLFKKKMLKNQKKLLDRIRELEQINIEKENEIKMLNEELFTMKNTQQGKASNSNDSSDFPKLDDISYQAKAPNSAFMKRKSKSISPKKRVEQFNIPARRSSATSVSQ